MQQALLTTPTPKAIASLTTAVATAPVLAQLPGGSIFVPDDIYRAAAVGIAIAGVVLARLVTVDHENKRIRRKQTMRETAPLTGIAVLIVAPFVWHYDIPVPISSLIGLGVGYAVLLVLRVLGNGAVAAAKAMAGAALKSLDGQQGEDNGNGVPRRPDQRIDDLLERIDRDESSEKL